MGGKICPLMTSFLKGDVKGEIVLCGGDGNAMVANGYNGEYVNYPCAGWKNGKCAFMRE